MKRTTIIALGLLACTGCGLLNVILVGGNETGSAQLKAFATEQELTDYFREQVAAPTRRQADFGAVTTDEVVSLPSAPPQGGIAAEGADGDATTNGFSQTTVQEQGVDEGDVVKTDGTYAYILRNDGAAGMLSIVQLDPADTLNYLSSVDIEGYGRELYLHDQVVVAISEEPGGYFIALEGPAVSPFAGEPVDIDVDVDNNESSGDGEPGSAGDSSGGMDVEIGLIEPRLPGDDATFQRPRTVVTIVNISDPTNPRVESTTRFDGVESSSRMIDGVLHLVLSNFQNYYYDAVPLLDDPSLDTAALSADDLLPHYEQTAGGTDRSGPIVSHEELYRPSDPDGFGVVTVVSLDVDDGAAFSATGIVAEPGLVYASTGAIYLTDTEYDFLGQTRETTDIYKFDLVDRGSRPAVSGSVRGRILNQYSMSEHDGFLRVATTVGRTFSLFGPESVSQNNVYVLQATADGLETVGQIEGIAPGETIQSARFVGDRGYVVTFVEIDPLFTLDMADPRNPRIVGELKVPGFSTFLQPIDENHLLAVGRYIPDDGSWPWAVQLTIFDVTDFANPQQKSNIVLGQDTGAYSEALFNPKALTWYPEQGLAALPINIDEVHILPFLPFEDDGVANDVAAPPPETTVTGDGGEPITNDDPEPPPIDPDVTLEDVEFVPTGFEGLVVFEIDVDAGLAELCRIDTRFPERNVYWSAFTRGIFIDDKIFAVTDRAVRGDEVVRLQEFEARYELLLESKN